MRHSFWRRWLRKRRSGPKVFGLGLSRTGTHSLAAALHRLGFDVVHYPTDVTTVRELMSGQCDLSLLRDHDGITDITTVPFYRTLDRQYPGSRFILTVREKKSWLESLRAHLERQPPSQDSKRYGEELYRFRRFLREQALGSDDFDRDRMSRAYDDHLHAVTAYFADRPDRLLVLDVSQGQGYERLCPFLGVEAIDEPFPRVAPSPTARS